MVRLTESGEVVLEVFDSVDPDLSDATWCWLFVSSNGTVKVVEAAYGEDSQTIVETVGREEVHWYADKRDWTMALEVNGSGKIRCSGKCLQASTPLKYTPSYLCISNDVYQAGFCYITS